MELDFDTLKALSSPTRIAILREVLEKESTTTQLSNELEKSKSTVSSHLAKLTKAGLLKKNKVEGRKRVTYESTSKARSIVKGREKKVKFSIASSAISAFAGIGLIGAGILSKITTGSSAADTSDYSSLSTQEAANQTSSGSMGIMSQSMESAANKSADAAQYAANTSSEVATSPELLQPENVFLFAGVLFIGTSALSFFYGWIMNKLG